MTMTYKSKILAAVHEAMADAHDVGVIDKALEIMVAASSCQLPSCKLQPEALA